ncbi:MAG TPA: efflux RND transporter periplasmic adaptor subunit [Polyangia bacterium]|nr:efflux RND transporter periplasmic adaptor subunit [Polyangia bacterium]
MTHLRDAFSAALLGTAVFAVGCGKAPQAFAPPPPTVTVADVEQREVPDWDEFIGRLEAVDSVEVRARVSGYVDRAAFKEGTEVGKGDLLFQIDPRPYQAELARAEAELAQARSAAALAARAVERSRPLVATEAMSREEFDNRAAAGERGAAAVQAAVAAVASARLNLEWTHVRSPIRGRVGRAEVTAGNLVQAGGQRLTTVVSRDPIYLSFDADERSYLKYIARRAAGSGERRVPVEMGMANEDGAFPHRGFLDFIDNRLDPRTGTARARAIFSNRDGIFAPGLFARVRLYGGSKVSAVTVVADRAVGTDQDRKFVLVLKPDSTVEYRPIQLGRLVDGYRVVTAGLKAGDRIIVNGLQRVRPGMKVSATPGPMLAQAQPSDTTTATAQ